MSRRLTLSHIPGTGFDPYTNYNLVDWWQTDTGNMMDPQSQSMPQYETPFPYIKTDGAGPPPSWSVPQLPGAPVHEPPIDPPSRSTSSLDRLTPSSGSSAELSPVLASGSFGSKQQKARAIKTDGMHVARRRDHDAAKVRKPATKKKKSPSPSSVAAAASRAESGENPTFTFCNMSPDNWGKGDFDGVTDLSRSSQKGRKGALSEDTRASALLVRKRGACFCCHVRKVKCDEKRPCENCNKLCRQVPQAMCWKFEDFIEVLLPRPIREHFAHEEMSRFVADNVQSFTLNGVEQHFTVTLSSGPEFMSKLVIKAKLFTAKMPTSDVLQHWYLLPTDMRADQVVALGKQEAVPIGLDEDVAKRNELRRKVADYVHDIVQEPSYPLQLTASDRDESCFRRQMLRVMLHIVHRYAQQSRSPIVKRGLSIYAMHYIMTRHLTLTQDSIEALRSVYPVSEECPDLTPRLLNRQIKAVIDEIIKKEVDDLFKEFSRRLKKKSREEWAPCLAAFVVLCMLMEEIETAAERFVKADSELASGRTKFNHFHAREINTAIEERPFRQFAIQFHQIYQTHTRDAKSLNPLADNNLSEPGGLDKAALDMVRSLRNMLQTNGEWLNPGLDGIFETNTGAASELRTMANPWLQDGADHYMGRLWSTFLLSFRDSELLLGPS